MPLLSFIVPQIPEDKKDTFLSAWPTLIADLKAQPGVAGASGGQIVAEDGAAASGFKVAQVIAFASEADEKTFSESAWSQEHKKRYDERASGEAIVGKFQVADFPKDKTPTPFIQYSTVVIEDASKEAELQGAWKAVVEALGKETWGGRSVGSGPTVGLGVLGWDSLEEAGAAFKDSKAAAAWEAYKSLGKTRNVMVKGL